MKRCCTYEKSRAACRSLCRTDPIVSAPAETDRNQNPILKPYSPQRRVADWALAQVGYTEGADNWNKYAPLVSGALGWNAQNQPWCSVFVAAGFVECFGEELGSRMLCTRAGSVSAACATNAAAFQAKGRFFSRPEVGDQIFFIYGGDINHTGIVVAVGEDSVSVVEGNSSDMVRKITYRLNDPSIAGCGRPLWDLANAAEGSEPQAFTPPVVSLGVWDRAIQFMPDLSFGDGMNDPIDEVKAWQALLNAVCKSGLDIDGEFGALTEEATREFISLYCAPRDATVVLDTQPV